MGRGPKTLDSVCETPSRRTHPIRRCGVVLPYLIRYGLTVAHVRILVALLVKPVEGNSIKYFANRRFFASLQRTISGVRGRFHLLLGCGFSVPDCFV